MAADPYLDPVSGVLRNRLGITDARHVRARFDGERVRVAGVGRVPVLGSADVHAPGVVGRRDVGQPALARRRRSLSTVAERLR